MSGLLLPPDVTQGHLDRALVVCERIASSNRSSLYLTSQFFEERSRYEAFIAMYAVMRVIDDRIDTIPNKARLPAERCAALDLELDCWDARIRAAFEGRVSNDSLDVALGAAVRTFPVPAGLWSNFINAMRFDIRHSRFSDFAEFLAYAEGATVAPAVIYVFLLASTRDHHTGRYSVSGFDFETCGRELGLSAYLAHILRDVVCDMRADETGRVYLSREDLRRHHLDEETLCRFIDDGAGDDRWRRLVKDLCARAFALEAHGARLAEEQYGRMPRDCAFILCLIIRIYSDLLRRIDAAPDDVLRGDPLPTMPAKATLESVAKRTGYPVSRALATFGREHSFPGSTR